MKRSEMLKILARRLSNREVEDIRDMALDEMKYVQEAVLERLPQQPWFLETEVRRVLPSEEESLQFEPDYNGLMTTGGVWFAPVEVVEEEPIVEEVCCPDIIDPLAEPSEALPAYAYYRHPVIIDGADMNLFYHSMALLDGLFFGSGGFDYATTPTRENGPAYIYLSDDFSTTLDFVTYTETSTLRFQPIDGTLNFRPASLCVYMYVLWNEIDSWIDNAAFSIDVHTGWWKLLGSSGPVDVPRTPGNIPSMVKVEIPLSYTANYADDERLGNMVIDSTYLKFALVALRFCDGEGNLAPLNLVTIGNDV